MKEQYNKNNLVEQPYEYYLHQYRNRNPELISSELGFPYSEVTGSFQVRFMGNLYNVTYPDFQITAQDKGKKIYTLAEDIHAQILLLRYIADGDYMKPSRNLLSYRDLPWGDEEFPPSAQILFSDNFALAFSPEDVAYVVDVILDYMKSITKVTK